ncbi:MAG: exosortase-associated EpsI family protein [Planctomycetota bacterium]
MATIVWAGLVFVLLGGVMVEHRLYREAPANADAYHERVKAAIDALPYSFDAWVGVDGTVPEAAVQMLHANRILSRRFEHMPTGRSVQVLIVHCTDSRDLIGHYPPVCYPANGWSTRAEEPIDLSHATGADVSATKYRFGRGDAVDEQEMDLFNFMVLPDGTLAPDMRAVERASQDYRKKFFGAAQVQILVPTDLDVDVQTELAGRFIELLEPVLDEIRSGVPAL